MVNPGSAATPAVSAQTRELVRLNRDLQTKAQYLQVINSFALSLLKQSTLEEVVWDVAKNAVARLGLEDCVIYLLNESGENLIQKAAHGPKNPASYDILNPIVIPVGQGIVGTVAATGQPQLVRDTRTDERYILDDAMRLSELAVPIIYHGKVIGVIDSEHHQANFYTEEHLELFTTIAALASTKIADAIQTEKLGKTIAELQRTEKALEEARAKAEGASHLKSEFLANMSHEIRTPLNAILGFNSLMMETELSERQREYIETMRQSGASLLTIVNDILDFSKIEAGKLELEVQPFDIRSCIDGAVNLVSIHADQKQLVLHQHVDARVPTVVVGDVTRVRQILVNLLNNAIKFTSKGGVSVSVSVEEVRANDEYVLHVGVKDTGIGITEEQQQKLFQPFSQAEAATTRKYGGTGLGLVICKHLTELMGGRIWVESEPDKGATFNFTFQTKAAQGVRTTGALRRSVSDPQLAERHPLKILLAEDNLINQKVMVRMLERMGYRPDVVGNGLDTLDALQRTPYDVVLMDIHMPGMDGVETTHRIRQWPEDRQPYVIAVTANALKGDRERFLAAGMDAYVSKPVLVEKLVAALKAVPVKA